MIRRPPRSTRTDTLFPYTTLFRSKVDPLRLSHQPVDLAELLAEAVELGKVDPREVLRLPREHLRLVLERANLVVRSEEHTSELQSLMRISYAVFCLKKKTQIQTTQLNIISKQKPH